eukprot:SAG31_NODE_7856_length_1582_cov_1.328388_3_plen_66_part_00
MAEPDDEKQQIKLLTGILQQLKELNGVREYEGSLDDIESGEAAENMKRLTDDDVEMQQQIFGKCR